MVYFLSGFQSFSTFHLRAWFSRQWVVVSSESHGLIRGFNICHIDLNTTSTTCFTIWVISSRSIERITVLYPVHFFEWNSTCFVQKLLPQVAHNLKHLQPHILHFAGSVFSILGISVMMLFLREIINELDLVLLQKCYLIYFMTYTDHAEFWHLTTFLRQNCSKCF